MILLALAFAFSAFTALAAAMNRHHESLFGQRPTAARALGLRLVGMLLLLLSLAACLGAWPAAVAVAAWWPLLAMAAFPVVLLLGHAGGLLRRLAFVFPLLAVLKWGVLQLAAF